jgi:hypothetical protein
MTHIQIQLPFGGFVEQSAFSQVPPGTTLSCLNVMPSDVWNGRTRIGTRNGILQYNLGDVQFMDTFRAYIGGTLVERIIFVRGGKVYWSDPNSSLPATENLYPGQSSALLATTGLVEGVQFNEYFYFVDGISYVKVLLTDTTTGASIWGSPTGTHKGPYHFDPVSSPSGNRATLICRWGARVVLSGFKKTPNVWYACAPDLVAATSSGDDGWDASEVIGAVGAAVSEDYGTLGDPIVAIFPFAQSGLMFACTNSFAFLTGDPLFETSGGEVQMVSLTNSIGIAGRRAWCFGQEKSAYILANDGLYYLQANDFNFNRANRISAGKLDSFFLRLDFGTPATGGSGILAGGTLRGVGSGSGSPTEIVDQGSIVESIPETIEVAGNVAALIGSQSVGSIFPCLCWDPDREGVWIFLSVSGIEEASVHLYYDGKTNSFWPQRFSDPFCYAPTSAVYTGPSRTASGRLFMGGGESISILDRAIPVGIDGWTNEEEMTEEKQRAQFVRSSLTVGPFIAPLPYRLMLNEIRVDMADDKYEFPYTDYSQKPVIMVSTGETAQSAVGLQTDVLYAININAIEIACGSAQLAPASPLYDGGGASSSSPTNRIDGRFAIRPFGEYQQNDIFASGSSRVYDGPGDFIIRYDTALTPDAWTIERIISTGPTVYEVEYKQVVADADGLNSLMVSDIQNPIGRDPDNANISGASFPTSQVFEIGQLDPGRNNAKRCRIRSEAMFMTVAADGRPWSVERMSAVLAQVGKSRGGS